jgi:large subunit ribosomal protein L3
MAGESSAAAKVTARMRGLIGRKVGMTRIFDKTTGREIPVTVIQTGTNVVHQVKTKAKDGYSAVQLGFEAVSDKKLTKPLAGHFKKLGSAATRIIKEFKLDSADEQLAAGQRVGVEIFENVKLVDVEGTTKGRGFTGTIKKYNFERGRETHGNTNHREPGSVGQNTYPGRVFPGLHMMGHWGNEQATIKRLTLVGIEKEAGLVYVRGAIPGPTRGLVYVYKA